MINRPRHAPDRLRPRLSRPLAGAEEIGDMAIQKGFSHIGGTLLNAAGLAFPGAGILISMVFSRLMNDSSKAETQAHFANLVVKPILEAARSKDFTTGASHLVHGTGKENMGYIYERLKGAVPAAYAVVLGHALAKKDFPAALRFAGTIDQLENDAIAAREAMRVQAIETNPQLLTQIAQRNDPNFEPNRDRVVSADRGREREIDAYESGDYRTVISIQNRRENRD